MRIGGVEIPEEIEPDARVLRRRCWVRAFLAFAALFLALGLVSFLAITWSNQWLRIAGGAATTTLTIAAYFQLRDRNRLDALALLRRLGYCSCGYKAMRAPAGGMLSCPECGRAWWPKRSPARPANNPP